MAFVRLRDGLPQLSTALLILALIGARVWAASESLQRVADLNTPIPAGSGNFTGFQYPAISGGNLAFLGFGSSAQLGVYFFNGSVLSRVADLNTAIPGGSGNFSEVDQPTLSQGNVAFFGFGSSGQPGVSGQPGLYLFNGSALNRVADLNTPIPGGIGSFASFFGGPPALSGSNIAFWAVGPPVQQGIYGQQGIYLFKGSVLSRVADLNTRIPGGSGNFTVFSGFLPPPTGGNVVFQGFGSSGQQGIYLFNGSALSRVADLNTPVPGGGTFAGFFQPTLSGSNVAFVGHGSSGQRGIYLFNGSALSRVADVNTPIPGGSGNFTTFSPVLSQPTGGNVAFHGFGSSGQQGLYLFNGSALSRVADVNTPIPGGSGNFTEFQEAWLSGGNVAFQGFGSSGQNGIYFFDRIVLTRVVDLNAAIPDGNGHFSDFSQPALSERNIAFLGFGLEQRGDRDVNVGQGIYLAITSAPPLPGPAVPTLSGWGMAIMIALLVAAASRAMRRRSA